MAATDTPPRGGKPDKLIRDALKAAIRQDPRHLKEIAEGWIERAKIDQPTANALADRIDGKLAQPISNDDDTPFQLVQRIERVIVNASDSDT